MNWIVDHDALGQYSSGSRWRLTRLAGPCQGGGGPGSPLGEGAYRGGTLGGPYQVEAGRRNQAGVPCLAVAGPYLEGGLPWGASQAYPPAGDPWALQQVVLISAPAPNVITMCG
jgi:hypothetical protein